MPTVVIKFRQSVPTTDTSVQIASMECALLCWVHYFSYRLLHFDSWQNFTDLYDWV